MDIKQYLKNYDHQHQTALKGERNEEFFKNSSKRYGDEPIIHEFAKVKDEPSREPNFTIGILFLIVMFLSANTFFLVYEQVTFYLLKSYHLYEAIFYSLLSEFALITLGFLSSIMVEKGWRMILRGLLLGSFAVITMIIHAGVKKRTHFEQEKTFLVQNIKQDIASLRESEQAILATISSLDVDKYQTKRDKLLGEVHRLRTELEIKNGKLENEGLAGGQERTENDVMLSLRYMALLWNVVLAQLLAYLLRSKLNFSFSNS